MRYHNGLEVLLGDIVTVPTPKGDAPARVVMLGHSGDHLEIDVNFLEWVISSNILAPTSIFIEWTGPNPFAHSDSHFAPVGRYMSTTVDEHVQFKSRAVSH